MGNKEFEKSGGGGGSDLLKEIKVNYNNATQINDGYKNSDIQDAFNFLDKVMFSWPKIKNINANIYNAFKFNENIDILKNFDTI